MKYSGKELFRLIKLGGKDAEKAFTYIRQLKELEVKIFVLRANGSVTDAQDLLQDALTTLFLAIKEDKLKKPDSLLAYFSRTYQNIWYRELEKKKKISTIDLDSMQKSGKKIVGEGVRKNDPFDFIIEEASRIRNDWLLKKLEQAGSKCKEILLAKVNKKSAREIANALNMTEDSVNSRTNQCKKRLELLLLQVLDYKEQELLRILIPSKRESWDQEVFLSKNQEKLLALGYSSVEEAKSIAIQAMGKLYHLLFLS